MAFADLIFGFSSRYPYTFRTDRQSATSACNTLNYWLVFHIYRNTSRHSVANFTDTRIHRCVRLAQLIHNRSEISLATYPINRNDDQPWLFEAVRQSIQALGIAPRCQVRNLRRGVGATVCHYQHPASVSWRHADLNASMTRISDTSTQCCMALTLV